MDRARREELNGFVVVDKPAGPTSHDVVAQVRKALKERRCGHSGTLDPGATGVLIVGVGLATRLLRFTSVFEKTYRGQCVLGVSTSTLDDAGAITGRFDMSKVSLEQVRDAAASFVGPIAQVPPMVSAVRIAGKRLYQLAQDGVEVARAPRDVVISALDIDASDEPGVFEVTVTCSAGTYVRSLVADIAAALGGGGHLRGLRRTAIGPFQVGDATPLDQVTREALRDAVGLVAHLPAVVVDGPGRDGVTHGAVFADETIGLLGSGPWALYDESSTLLAVYERWREHLAKPALVLVASYEKKEPRDAEPAPQ